MFIDIDIIIDSDTNTMPILTSSLKFVQHFTLYCTIPTLTWHWQKTRNKLLQRLIFSLLCDCSVNQHSMMIIVSSEVTFLTHLFLSLHLYSFYLLHLSHSSLFSSIPLSSLFFPLCQAQHSILYPEEWDYFYAQQVSELSGSWTFNTA
jgi:hypothetical protein